MMNWPTKLSYTILGSLLIAFTDVSGIQHTPAACRLLVRPCLSSLAKSNQLHFNVDCACRPLASSPLPRVDAYSSGGLALGVDVKLPVSLVGLDLACPILSSKGKNTANSVCGGVQSQ